MTERPAVEVVRVASAGATRKKPRSISRYLGLGAGLAGLVVGALSFAAPRHRPANTAVHHGTALLKYTQKGAEVRWRLRDTQVLIDSSLAEVSPGAEAAVKTAFSTWLNAEPELPAISFANTSNATLTAKPDGKNTVMFAKITVPGHEHDLAITLTYSDEDTGDIVEADVIVNSEYPFKLLQGSGNSDSDDSSGENPNQASGDGSNTQQTVNASRASCQSATAVTSCSGGAYDLQNVVTHEVGHFFGLGEDMDDSAATMYFCTSRCETHKRVLTNTDTSVMSTLYAASADGSKDTGAGCGGARVAPRGGLAEAALVAALSLFGFARRRRSTR